MTYLWMNDVEAVQGNALLNDFESRDVIRLTISLVDRED